MTQPKTAACLRSDDVAQNVACWATEGERPDTLGDYRLPLGRGLAGTVELRGEAASVGGVGVDPAALGATRQAVLLPVWSAPCAPLVGRDRVFGVPEALASHVAALP